MLDIKDFNLPQDLPKYLEAVKEFARTYLEEKALEMEETDTLPADLQPTMKKAGLLDLRLPKDVGGLGLTFSQYWPILVEAGKPHGTIRQNVHGFNTLWTMLYYHGTEEQKKKWFPIIWGQGKGYAAFALTEPGTGTGVDIKTTARREGDYYIINGTKHLITFADIAPMFHVVCYTGDRSLKEKGTSIIIVEADNPGVVIEPHGPMMSIRGCYHGIIHFRDAKVPVTNILGKEGEGLDIALRTFLDQSRLSIGASCLPIAERMLEKALEYARGRITFGKPIGDRQAIQMMLAEMAVPIYAQRLMVADCAEKYDRGESIVYESAMCKLAGIEMTKTVSDLAMNVFGGLSIVTHTGVERTYRDARALWFEEGAPTIQKTVIARHILGKRVRSIGD